MKSLQEIVRSVAAREIPRDAGVRIIAMAFGLEESEADRIIGTAGASFSPATDTPEP